MFTLRDRTSTESSVPIDLRITAITAVTRTSMIGGLLVALRPVRDTIVTSPCFHISLEPCKHPIAKICLIRETPISGGMSFSRILCIYDLLTQPAQPYEYLVSEKGSDTSVFCAMHE